MNRYIPILAAYAVAAPLAYLLIHAYIDLIIAVGRMIGTA